MKCRGAKWTGFWVRKRLVNFGGLEHELGSRAGRVVHFFIAGQSSLQFGCAPISIRWAKELRWLWPERRRWTQVEVARSFTKDQMRMPSLVLM